MPHKARLKVVACDINIGSRVAVVQNLVLATALAKFFDASVINHIAYRVIRMHKFFGELSDAQAIAEVGRVKSQTECLKITPYGLRLNSIRLLVTLLFLSVWSPRALSRFSSGRVYLGRNICDQQRRATLYFAATRFGQTSEVFRLRAFGKRLRNSLFFYAARGWFQWQYWHHFLSVHDVMAGVFVHTEREMGTAFELFSERDIPVFRTLEFIEIRDYPVSILSKRLKSNFECTYQSNKKKIFQEVQRSFNNELNNLNADVFLKRVHTRIHPHFSTQVNLEFLQSQLSQLNKTPIFLIALNHPYEAYNFDQAPGVFANYEDFFLAVRRAQLQVDGCQIWLKLHPELEKTTSQRYQNQIEAWIKKKKLSDWKIIPTYLSLEALKPVAQRLVVIVVYSNIAVHAGYLQMRCLYVGADEKCAWPFAMAPKSVSDFHQRLVKWEAIKAPNLYDVVAADFCGNYTQRRTHPELFRQHSGDEFDLNLPIKLLSNEYFPIDSRKVLSTELVRKAINQYLLKLRKESFSGFYRGEPLVPSESSGFRN